MKSVTIEVNGKPITCGEGALLIDVLKHNDIFIPHFCYHEALGADGNCRMCMVRIEGQKRLQIACDTFVQEGMIVNTEDDSIRAVNRNILELELINHPVDCPICDQAGECSLQKYYMAYGLYDTRLDTPKNLKQKHVDLGSNVVLDQERCVLCARCTRFTQEITGTAELAIMGRGDHAHVSTVPGKKLDNPYAMNVVDLCPVGALTSRDFRFAQRVWLMDETPGICHGCARGCNVWIDHNKLKYAEDRIYRFRPRVNLAINGHFLCDEGRLSYKALNAKAMPPRLNGEESDEATVIDTFRKVLVTGKGRGLMEASADLSLEQLATIRALADHYNFALFSFPTIDREFGDDMLRCDERSANAAALIYFAISTEEDVFRSEKEKAAVLVRFTRTSITFEVMLPPGAVRTSGALPFANFAYDSGTLISIDGIMQRFDAAGEPPLPTLLEVLHRVDGTLPATTKEAWKRLVGTHPAFTDVTFDSLKTAPHQLQVSHDL